jgi:hypothetical protein
MSFDNTPWIGFDLDGTLAEYTHWVGPHVIGKPIWPMVAMVKGYLAEGMRVKIFTARVGPHGTNYEDGRAIDPEHVTKAREAIENWCIEQFGQKLEVTCEKDFNMLFIFDDRAVQVEPNTGKVIGKIL